MSIVRRLRGGEVRNATVAQAIRDGRSRTRAASLVSAGTVDGALAHPAVYRSVNKIAGVVAQFPWELMLGADTLPRPAVMLDPQPGWFRPSAWKRAAATSMLLAGGANVWVTATGAGVPTRLDLLDPARVKWDAKLGWLVGDQPVDTWPIGPLLHVPFMTLPGSPQGVNPLEYARRTTYAGLAAAEFGSNFFRDGAHPTAVVTPGADPGNDGALALKERIMAAVSGTNREPLIVSPGTTFEQIQISPDDSQFIELMQFTAGQIAGFFGLLPDQIGMPVEGSSMNYANRENRQQDLLQDAVMPVVMPLEEALSELFPRPSRVKFNVEGLLRADQQARFLAYESSARIEQMTGQPVFTNDEIRELENRRPLEADGGEPTARDIAEMIQKIYVGVGVVLTSEEARRIINRGGAGLVDGPLPTEGSS